MDSRWTNTHREKTHHSRVPRYLCGIGNDAFDVSRFVHEAQPLAERDLAHHVKRKVVQPQAEVARLSILKLLQLAEENVNSSVHIRLKLDEVRHGIHAGDGSTESTVVDLILGVENPLDDVASDNWLEDSVKVGLRQSARTICDTDQHVGIHHCSP